MTKTALQQFVEERAQDCRVLVVGDVMLDKYYYGEVKRISPEAPVPVTRVLREKETLGGAANVAHNLALLGCHTYLCGVVGDDYHRQSLEEKLAATGIHFEGLICTPGPTTTKLRVLGGHQQMIRLDFEETAPVAGSDEKALLAYVELRLQQGIDSVIISDYAKGVCTPAVCEHVIKICANKGVPVVIDPKGGNWNKYSGADYITPNLKELNEVLVKAVANDDEAVSKAAKTVKRKYRIKNIVATRSERGLSLISSRAAVHIPTLAQEVFDVSGAGDTVIAVLALALAGKIEPAEAAFLANLAASVVVAKLGTYAVSKAELLLALNRTKEQVTV